MIWHMGHLFSLFKMCMCFIYLKVLVNLLDLRGYVLVGEVNVLLLLLYTFLFIKEGY